MHTLSILLNTNKCFLDHLNAATQLYDVSVQVKGAFSLILTLLKRTYVRVNDVGQMVGLVQVVLRLVNLHLKLAQLSVQTRYIDLLADSGFATRGNFLSVAAA